MIYNIIPFITKKIKAEKNPATGTVITQAATIFLSISLFTYSVFISFLRIFLSLLIIFSCASICSYNETIFS
jgi:glucan phosphoethanolaminetransferase (alkaline phosphatase superfamily)